MSMEEDTELRDLVAQTLEINGCLPKIRAELRASIFLALDENDEMQKQEPLLNNKVKAQLESPEGQVMFCLVREFLEFYNLDFTISVYEPESYLGKAYKYEGRSKIIEDLAILQFEENPAVPLLLQIIQIAQVKNVSKNIDINLSKLQNEGCSQEDQVTNSNEELHIVKTKAEDLISENSEISSSNDNSLNGVLKPPISEFHASAKPTDLNTTFEVRSPVFSETVKLEKFKPSIETILSPRGMNSSKSGSDEKDDTYDGTSSIAEDSTKESPQLDVDKIAQESEFSPPILKDIKSHSKFDVSFDKLKLSPQKTEKLKAKNSLSSLADLPPLQLNKSRNDTVLLPSLYSKEFKDKSTNQNLRELNKFFDIDADSTDNYEEDFMSESEINLNSSARINEELQSSTVTDSNKNISVRSVESKNNSGRGFSSQSAQKSNLSKEKLADHNKNLENDKTVSSKDMNGVGNNGTSSITSDELNLSIEDILNSPTSN